MANYLDTKHKCIIKNCMKEQNNAIKKNDEYSNKIMEILQKFEDKKISEYKLNKNINNIQRKIQKNKEKINFLNCQINHCHNIIYKNIINNIKQSMKLAKHGPLYENSKKYLLEFKKNGITANKIIQYEIDGIKEIKL